MKGKAVVRYRGFVNRALLLYSLMLLSLNALSWGVYLLMRKRDLLRPLFLASDRHRDLTAYADKISHLDRGAAALGQGFPLFNYPAPAAYVYAFFLRGFPLHPMRAYVAFLVMAMSSGVFLLWMAARARHAASWALAAALLTTATLGFPLVFAVDRGNIEGVVGTVLGVGLVLLVFRRFYASAIFIGLAASIKPFPGLFLLLLLRRRQYRAFAAGAATAVCSVVLALAALGPTPLKAYDGLHSGVRNYVGKYIMTFPSAVEGRFYHSSMDAMKSLTTQMSSLGQRVQGIGPESRTNFLPPLSSFESAPGELPVVPPTASQAKHMRVVFLVSTFVQGAGLIYALVGIFKLPAVNQVLLIGIAITLFAPSAAEYTLIHLYVPFGFFLLFLVRDVGTGAVAFTEIKAVCFLALFALLFSPLSFFGKNSGNAKTFVLLTLLIAAKRHAMPSSLFDELGENQQGKHRLRQA